MACLLFSEGILMSVYVLLSMCQLWIVVEYLVVTLLKFQLSSKESGVCFRTGPVASADLTYGFHHLYASVTSSTT